MDNKDYWQRVKKAKTAPRAGAGKAYAPLSLDPDYRAGEKKSPTAPAGKSNVGIDAILTECLKQTAGEDKASNMKPQRPAASKPSGSEADAPQVMREMISTMRELTEEVKQLRAQIETAPNSGTSYPRGRPPEISATAAEMNTPVSDAFAADTPKEHSPETVLEGFASPEIEAHPNIRGEPEDLPEASAESPKPPEASKKKNKALSIISNVLFYVIVVAMVFGAFLIKSNSGGRPTVIAGYSTFTVLTSSMEDVYPKGSLIITKAVDAKDLKVGDDITYMVSETSSITHRIIGITENFQSTGDRAFETQGVMNPTPDRELVAAANVVGKVVFHSKTLGDMANFVKQNWPFLLFFIIVLVGLITFLKWNAKKSGKDEQEPEEEATKKDTDPAPKHKKKSERRKNEHGNNQTKNNRSHRGRRRRSGADAGRDLRLDQHQSAGEE